MVDDIRLRPIAWVKNDRKEVADDQWGAVVSEIVLAEDLPEDALEGIEGFSHLEIIYYFHKVMDEKAIAGSRHPRNNPSLPIVGTFAQRNKNRPNKLGLASVSLLRREGRRLWVSRLDAINDTPILDIKPVMEEFEPVGSIQQAAWTKVILDKYW